MQYVITFDINSVLYSIDPLMKHLLDQDESFPIISIWYGFAGYMTVRFCSTGSSSKHDVDFEIIEEETLVHIRDAYLLPMTDIALLQKTYHDLINNHSPQLDYIFQRVQAETGHITTIDCSWPSPLINNNPNLIVNTVQIPQALITSTSDL